MKIKSKAYVVLRGRIASPQLHRSKLSTPIVSTMISRTDHDLQTEPPCYQTPDCEVRQIMSVINACWLQCLCQRIGPERCTADMDLKGTLRLEY